MGALFVPECERFGWTESNPHCVLPVIWLIAGYLAMVVGVLILGWGIVRWRRNRPM